MAREGGGDRGERRRRASAATRCGAGRAAAAGPRRPGGRRPGEATVARRGASAPAAPTSTVHRNAMLAALRPEQIPVAEQLLRGGLQAVRQAIEAQNTSAKAGGKPPVAADALLAMADELLPVVRLADWKDRASVAQTAGKDYRLRELRAVVAASRTVILDEEGRAMAKALQESLDQRTTGSTHLSWAASRSPITCPYAHDRASAVQKRNSRPTRLSFPVSLKSG